MKLISKEDIRLYREVSKSVADVKINPFIDDAQILDLKPLLGEKFYFDIISNVANYSDLLNVISYPYNDQQIESPGIKKVLCHFAYARYIMHGSQTDTPFGLVQKDYQDSTPISRTDKKETYKHTQQIAMQYWSEVENYLNRNAKDYPLWKVDCGQDKRKSFRFNFISR